MRIILIILIFTTIGCAKITDFAIGMQKAGLEIVPEKIVVPDTLVTIQDIIEYHLQEKAFIEWLKKK